MSPSSSARRQPWQPVPRGGYVCAGEPLSIWFAGELSGDALALREERESGDDATPAPDAEATMTAVIDPAGVRGDAVVAGRTLTLVAEPAEGVAGLWEVSRGADGTILGASSTGAVLTARQTAAPSSTPAIGSVATPGASDVPAYPIAGTIVLHSGADVPFAATAYTAGADDFRRVMLEDGSRHGARRKRKRRGNDGKGKDKNNGNDRDEDQPQADEAPPPSNIEQIRDLIEPKRN